MRLLDLCCGEGLAAWGYWASGCFSEIVGVDTDASAGAAYAFDFICADALALTYDFLLDFDFIHVSPPCQGYSKITPDQSIHKRQIKDFRLLVEAVGCPYVIENVEGSGLDLRPNLALRGWDVGLPFGRVRYFRMSGAAAPHVVKDKMRHVAAVNVHGGDYVSRAELIAAFGLGVIPEKRLRRLTMHGIEQGIPPAFTLRIAAAMFPKKFMIG